MIAGGVAGFAEGLKGAVYDQSWQQIMVGAGTQGALNGIGGGLAARLGTIGGVIGGALNGGANAYLNGSKAWTTYAAGVITGGLFGALGSCIENQRC